MRDLITLIENMFREEGEVVSLKQHKWDKALGDYTDVMREIIGNELEFFKKGKFSCFAVSYIESGFNPDYAPEIMVDVNFRDYRSGPDAKALLASLRSQKFKITPSPYANYAKGGTDWNPNDNPSQNAMGPFARKVIDLNTAKKLFAERENSPLGPYQPSQSGMRTVFKKNWDERGFGFNISVFGIDNRRGDKYGNAYRQEHHIIDNDKDMKEVSDAFAVIQRARIKSI